ncbi:MAG: FHA domain-containing protein [Deltaproteobacteria bacterium]|nr:FHA domain-containing protein [Deltaproteobacteria bacterium]
MPVKLQVVMSIPGKDPREFEYEFEDDRICVGRDQENEIQVPLSTVSRKHCVFFRDADEWYLEDLKSTHGTKHNGKPVGAGGKKLLRSGDVVDLIHFKLTFHNAAAASPDYSAEKTEALARKMVEEVLASIGKDAADVPYVRVMNGPDEGKRFDIGVDVSEAVVGRGNDCDFQINDANISRRHGIIRRDWNEITVEDAGSKNGVLINDRKIAKATALRDADEILLGAVRLTFIDPSAKFIGKLDDIPAFADAQTGVESSALDDDDQEQSEGDGGDGDGPGPEMETNTGEAADGGSRVQGTRAGGNNVDDDGGAPEPGAFEDDDDDVDRNRGLGIFEIALIGGAVIAVIGLAIGVAVLVVGS